MRKQVLAAFALGALTTACLAARQEQVDVVVDMTPEGRAVPPPTPEKHAFYLPIVGGYKEMGALVAGEKPPRPIEVVHVLATELAKQGYFVISKANPNPSLILAIHWGYMNPQVETFDPGDPTSKVFFNQNQMLALVGGNTLKNLDLDFEREEVMQGAEQDRYFIVVTAFDFAAYSRDHRKVKLWQAKMSVPSNGISMEQAMPTLAKAGGPLFGRETVRPKMLILPVDPQGRVEIGPLSVKDYQDAPAPKPEPPKAPISDSATQPPARPAP